MPNTVLIQQLNNMNYMQYMCQHLHVYAWQPNQAIINYRRGFKQEKLPSSRDSIAIQTTPE